MVLRRRYEERWIDCEAARTVVEQARQRGTFIKLEEVRNAVGGSTYYRILGQKRGEPLKRYSKVSEKNAEKFAAAYGIPVARILWRGKGLEDPQDDSILEDIGAHSDYRQIAGWQKVVVHDERGATATWVVGRRLIVGPRPLTHVEFPIYTAGIVEPISVSPGRMVFPTLVGGIPTARVEFDTAIEPFTQFDLTSQFLEKDSFIDDEVVVHATPREPYDYYEIEVTLPSPNLIHDIEAYESRGSRKIPLPGLTIVPDLTHLDFRIERPQVGVTYNVAWSWIRPRK